jgi:hypothetical protein
MEAGGQLHSPAALLPEKNARTHSVGGYVGPRAPLDVLEKKKSLASTGVRNSDHSSRTLVAIPTTPQLPRY